MPVPTPFMGGRSHLMGSDPLSSPLLPEGFLEVFQVFLSLVDVRMDILFLPRDGSDIANQREAIALWILRVKDRDSLTRDSMTRASLKVVEVGQLLGLAGDGFPEALSLVGISDLSGVPNGSDASRLTSQHLTSHTTDNSTSDRTGSFVLLRWATCPTDKSPNGRPKGYGCKVIPWH